MLTLSERGDTWQLALHIKHLPWLPVNKKYIIKTKESRWLSTQHRN